MKNKIIILTVFAGLLLSACSDYLDRKPYTQPNNEDFLKTRENVESYINNLYTSLPAPAQYGIGVRGEEVNSDNILSEKYDMRLNGENNQFSGSDDWNKGYKNLRMVNYFFHYYAVSEVDETDEVLSLRGEAYFFRAYWHFYLLTRFGNIPIMDAAQEILSRYTANAYCQTHGVLLPVCSNQKMNVYLKELADVCGIRKLLSTHTARHTFATLTLANGATIENVAKMLGHSDTKMTCHYARILDSSILRDMRVVAKNMAL